MKWVKVITTIDREDWVQVADDAQDAVRFMVELVNSDKSTYCINACVQSETVVPPMPQDCKLNGIGYHPL